MSYQSLQPVLRQFGQQSEDFDLVDNNLAGALCMPACISAYIEKVGSKYRTVSLFEIDGIESQTLSACQSIVYMHPEEITLKKGDFARHPDFKNVRDFLN